MKNPRTIRRLVVCAVFITVMLAAGSALAEKKPKGGNQPSSANAVPSAVPGAKYVGSDQCKTCHEDQLRIMQGTPHYRIFGKQNIATEEGCEGCHGPGSAHIDGGGDKTKILRFSEMSAEESSAVCLTCHSKGKEQQHFQRSVHLRAGVSCMTCHSSHHSRDARLLSKKQPDLCFGCHAETKADFMKPFHHRVVEGLVACSDCHNTHGTTSPKQLRETASQDAVCLKCHSDLHGPWVFQHEPVKSEGCSTCHTPHGSTNPRMIKTSTVNSLCLQCHQNFYNPPHPQNTKSQACTMCHTAIHGSNTSNVLFKR